MYASPLASIAIALGVGMFLYVSASVQSLGCSGKLRCKRYVSGRQVEQCRWVG